MAGGGERRGAHRDKEKSPPQLRDAAEFIFP